MEVTSIKFSHILKASDIELRHFLWIMYLFNWFWFIHYCWSHYRFLVLHLVGSTLAFQALSDPCIRKNSSSKIGEMMEASSCVIISSILFVSVVPFFISTNVLRKGNPWHIFLIPLSLWYHLRDWKIYILILQMKNIFIYIKECKIIMLDLVYRDTTYQV